MRAAVVLNTNAGSLIGRDDVTGTVKKTLGEHGIEAEFFDEAHGSLDERIEAARDSGADMVIVGGGDGSIACAAQALTGTDLPLAIIPLGTMNLMARDLDIPLDFDEALAAIADGDVRSIDVGSVNGHVFLCNSVIGVAAVLQRQRERDRKMPFIARWWRLGIASLKALVRFRPNRLGVHFANRTRRMKTRAMVIAVNGYDREGAQPLHRSHLDGGELVLYATGNFGALRLMSVAAGLATGSAPDTVGIEEIRTPRLAISSPRRRIRVMSDGELHLLSTPLRYRIHRRALKVVVPAVAVADMVDAVEADAAPAAAAAAG